MMYNIFIIIITILLNLLNFTYSSANDDIFLNWFQDQFHEIIDDAVYIDNINGTIPKYLKGNYIHVGPSVKYTNDMNYTNYIDAFGRVTCWKFDNDNKLSFKSSIIKSSLWNSSIIENNINELTIARHITQEKTNPITKPGVFDLLNMDNTDVNVFQFPNQDSFITFTDFYASNEIDLESLRTLGSSPILGDTPTGTFFSGSHPGKYIDTVSGEIYLINWLGSKTIHGSKLYIYKMGNDRIRKVIGSVDIDFEPYSIHSIVVVEHYVVVIVGPVAIDFMKTGVTLCLSCSIEDHMKDQPTKLFIFDILNSNSEDDDNTDVKPINEYTINPSFFVFHYINTQLIKSTINNNTNMKKDSNSLIMLIDVCAYDSMDGVLGEYVLGNLNNLQHKKKRNEMPYFCDNMKRIEIDLNTNSMIKSINNIPIKDNLNNNYRIELASINPNYFGKEYCYVYALTFHVYNSTRYEDMGLLKIDICKGIQMNNQSIQQQQQSLSTLDNTILSNVMIWNQTNIYLGEPIFVPNPNPTSTNTNNRYSNKEVEDDGILLVVSMDGNHNQTNLLIFDASTLQLLATAPAPFPLMFQFHGNFFPLEI